MKELSQISFAFATITILSSMLLPDELVLHSPYFEIWRYLFKSWELFLSVGLLAGSFISKNES